MNVNSKALPYGGKIPKQLSGPYLGGSVVKLPVGDQNKKSERSTQFRRKKEGGRVNLDYKLTMFGGIMLKLGLQNIQSSREPEG